MTRKDYIVLAEWLGNVGVERSTFEYLLASLCVTLAAGNSNFNEAKFVTYARDTRAIRIGG